MIGSRSLLVTLCIVLASVVSAAADDGEVRPRTKASRLPAGVEGSAENLQETESGDVVLEGAVTLRWGESRFQADRIVLREERYLEAQGNVLVVWGSNRVSGTSMTYDLETDRGVIENAVGQVDPEFFFSADRVEKIGEDKVFLDSATVTTCTQPVPYWSFSVSSARIRLDHYARMWNLRLKARKLPVFYLPYMVWPVKKDRSAGLLFPNFGSTQDRGNVLSEALFIPLGASADLTLVGEYYTEAGFGAGGEFRLIPNRDGFAVFNGFYIKDKVAGTDICSDPPCDRWRASYRQTQEFRNGFRMVADINQLSDFDYFSDFERDLRLISSRTVLARLEFSRNGKWTSINVRDLRREQLVSVPQPSPQPSISDTLVQQTLPEVELRGRDRRLGRSPFYLSYESSFATIQQQLEELIAPDIDSDYIRADLFPTISVPLSGLAWLDINPQASYRLTYYSQSKDPVTGQIVNDDLVRGAAAAGIEIVGPKLSRIFDRGEDKPRYKHLVEPRVIYAFGESFDRSDEVIRYDEVDLIPPKNLLTYGLRTRLFTKRPRAESPAPMGSGESILMPGMEASPALSGPMPLLGREGLPGIAEPGTGPQEPLEIATLELRQDRSFDNILTCADLDGDGAAEESSHASNVTLTGRLNPNPLLSFDVRGSYHPLYNHVQGVTLSGNVRRRKARVGFSVVRSEGRGCSVQGNDTFFPLDGEDDTQLRLDTGFILFGGKLRLDMGGSYLANPGVDRNKVPERRARIEYYTQCCGFLAEYLARDFTSTSRREFRFTVDLRGIGKFLDLHHGEDR